MWETLQWDGQDLQWLLESLSNGWLKVCADGSYDWKVGPKISGAGLILYYTKTGIQDMCSFYEVQ